MTCPICHRDYKKLLHEFGSPFHAPILEALQEKAPGWTPRQGACTRCVDQAQLDAWAALKGSGMGTEINGYKILPIPTRLMAHPHYTGKGVTICFIDSGFYSHPDLEGRIFAALDIPNGNPINLQTSKAESSAWHGTMTSVVCAGDGKLSGGVYKGLASEARLVLLKVTDVKGAITGENIAKAIRWAIENKEKYNINILNLSVTDDWATSYKENEVDQAIEAAVGAGIVVIVAAGNDDNAALKAPANSPHAITVGGLDDQNTLHPLTYSLYHSTFGETVDGTHKPELIAPAIWIPAPILPETKEQQMASALFELANTKDDGLFKTKFANLAAEIGFDQKLVNQGITTIRQKVWQAIENRKLISAHYQHADGTSFAAPIVSSLVAQMLEANPSLTPAAVREILLRTARKLENAPTERQGYGVVHPLSAVYAAEVEHHELIAFFTPVINYKKKVIEFHLHDHEAAQAVATGDFTNWSAHEISLQQTENGKWSIQYPMLPKGIYRYKFLINQEQWLPDPTNLFRELDGFGGFNSKFIIE